MNSDTAGERLQKVLARAGFGSRRVCDDLIAAGRVIVNDDVAILGQRIDADNDTVIVDGVRIGVVTDFVYYVVNKPKGVITTAIDPHGRDTVVALVPSSPRVFPVGRLDAATEGLLLLTNDGRLANEIAHPSHGVEKEYLAELADDLSPGAIRALREGVDIGDDTPTAPAKVARVGARVVKITIHEGRNRQVRRMCEAVGTRVVRLVRTRIGPLRDATLEPGEWRRLSATEVRAIERAAASSARAPVTSK